jgi:rubrerythrin
VTEVPVAVLDALREAARAERTQAAYYRALASRAEPDSPDLAERLNGLVADEQHHLSRLVARLLELDAGTAVDEPDAFSAGLEGWETEARLRERGEIDRYEALLGLALDAKTRSMLEGFLEVERRHEAELGGKWMAARGDGC